MMRMNRCLARTRSKQATRLAAGTVRMASTKLIPKYDVVVVGAGCAGVTVSAALLARKPGLRVALIDPAEEHHYQPGWTMVGGGVFTSKQTAGRTENVIPSRATWIKEAVSTFQPETNRLTLADNSSVAYDRLVVAAGLQLNWNAIDGLVDTIGKNGVTSNYGAQLAPYTWELVRAMKKGKALFTQPPMPIKCAGAPQKALYLSADYWRQQGVLDKIDITFCNSNPSLFGVPTYVPPLKEYMAKYGVDLHFGSTLFKVDGASQTASFKRTAADGSVHVDEREFDFLHVCPPQGPPDFIRNSPLADANGWVDVDPTTLRSTKFSNVWSLGDAMNAPNAKTMAAVRKQAPIVAENLLADTGDPVFLPKTYDGYGSCPLTVERGKILLAEFGYGGKLLPTLPSAIIDGSKPSRLAWYLKEMIMPPIYWQAMVKGIELPV